MAKTGKIAPIQKQYGDSINTMDQQLSKHGYVRSPGTFEFFIPHKEASGKYRTGLDVEASYLNKLVKEDRDAEVARIIADRERLEKAIGIPGLLGPTSLFYNFAADKGRLEQAFGSEIKVSPVKASNDAVVFDLSVVLQEITWNWIKVHPRIAPSMEAFTGGRVNSEVKYYVVDDDVETKLVYNKKKEINKAIVAFDALTPSKKKQFGRLMGLPVTEDTPEETVYNLLDTLLKETEFKSGANKGFSPIRVFNELLNTTVERLEIKDLVNRSITHNIYRLQGDIVKEGSVTVSGSKNELIEFLLDDKNQMDLIALKKKLKVALTEKA